MKIPFLILVLTLMSCGKDHKKHKSSGIPYVLVNDNGPALVTPGETNGGRSTGGSTSAGATAGGSTTGEVATTSGGSTAGGTTTGGTTTGEVATTSGGSTTGEVATTSGCSTAGGSTTGEVATTSGDPTAGGSTTGEVATTSGGSTSGGTTTGEVATTSGGSTSGGTTTGDTTTHNDDVISSDASVVRCDFTKDQEKETFILNITKDGNNRFVSLSNENDKGKVVFGGYILSPSGNENAAVQHTDKNFSIEEGKVIKITARIVFDTKTGEGQLQLSYSVKGKKGKAIETGYSLLAEINNCSELN